MMLPLAHIGHFLWIFYVLPVLIVIGGIIRSTRVDKRREREEAEAVAAKRPKPGRPGR
jgi:cytochrome c-type biogenesis protein CcmH/NrfF